MRPSQISDSRRLQLLLILLLGTAVGFAMLLTPGTAQVEARCYGKYAGKCRRYVGACQRGCAKEAGVLAACAKRGSGGASAQCQKTFQQLKADCGGNRTCMKQAKGSLKSCIKDGKKALAADMRFIRGRTYGVGPCKKCCKYNDGQNGCLGSFGSSRWYGSSRSYGRLNCQDNSGGDDGGGPPTTLPCNPKTSRGGCPPVTTTTTPLTTTTTTTPHGSPSGAFVARGFTGSVQSYLASLVPSLTSGW